MAHLVVFDFPSPGPFGEEAAEAYRDLAKDIAAEEGLVWKVWTEDVEAKTAGGVYLFDDRASADSYIQKHTARLGSFGITDITTARHDVNGGLSAITHAVLARD